MSATEFQLNHLEHLLHSPRSALKPGDPAYDDDTKTWGAQRALKPRLVLKPESMGEVQALTQYLASQSDLDFVVRNGGVGSASSEDVQISLSNFKDIRFDEGEEAVYVGAGCLWEDLDIYMRDKAPGWAVVSCRTPFVGVTGTVLCGGLSWLSHEFGLISDPQNLLDAQMVLADGQLVWASTYDDGELLWALRGGRCALGVVTCLKFRGRRYPTEGIFAGTIRLPIEKLAEVSEKVALHIATNRDPKVAFHAYMLNHKGRFFDAPPGVELMVFDANGVEHGRGADGFKWALDIDGAQDMTRAMSLYEVNQLTMTTKPAMGVCIAFDATGLVDTIDTHFLERANSWWEKVLSSHPGFATGSYCLFETMQPAVFGSTASVDATAWPHSGHKQVLQLGVGYPPAQDLKADALRLLKEAYETIPLQPLTKGDFTPNFMELELMSPRAMYGTHYQRLEWLSAKYDPRRRFRSIFNPGPNWL